MEMRIEVFKRCGIIHLIINVCYRPLGHPYCPKKFEKTYTILQYNDFFHGIFELLAHFEAYANTPLWHLCWYPHAAGASLTGVDQPI